MEKFIYKMEFLKKIIDNTLYIYGYVYNIYLKKDRIKIYEYLKDIINPYMLPLLRYNTETLEEDFLELEEY